MLILILVSIIIYTIILKKIILKKKVEYEYYREIPSEEPPAIVGKILKGHADGNDIIATILTLVQKGYIKIKKEKIRGKEKVVLYLERNIELLELQEYEIFLINQIFKNSNTVVFEDYIKSKKFKQNFKIFDEMLDRRIVMKKVSKTSILKHINKIVLLIIYAIFGSILFYSIIFPIILVISKIDIYNANMISNIISRIIYIFIAYQYVKFINKRTNAQENINLNIVYIILCILLGISLIFSNKISLHNIVYEEFILYRVITNAILGIITLMYMFNLINHTQKEEYMYYIFIIISIFTIILNMNIGMAICIIFYANYVFFKSPKHLQLKKEEEIYKWNAFKKYLEDYSMLSQQESNALQIWDRYFVYAISLGVNKKIIKKYVQLKNINWINKVFLKNMYIEYFE